jgi:ABC-2 type transport system permease protein
MVKNLRTFWFIMQLNMRQAFYHKGGAIAMILVWSVRVGVTVLLYANIYKLIGQQNIKGISLEVAISGMMFFAIYSSSSGREIPKRVTAENKSGGIEVWFSKPIPYLLLKLGEVWGKNVPTMLGIAITCFVCWFFVSGKASIDHSILRFVLAVMLLLLGSLISVTLYMLVSLTAIFLVESKAVNYIVDKLIMLFGGIYIPVAFFPTNFRVIGEMLPTTAATYGSQFLYPNFLDNVGRFFTLQIIWLVVLYAGLIFMQNKANKHLTVNGG